MHVTVELFLALWCSPFCIVALVNVVQGELTAFICLGPILFVYLMVLLFFNFELRRSLHLINEIYRYHVQN
jgi:uncharacterized membrane protein